MTRELLLQLICIAVFICCGRLGVTVVSSTDVVVSVCSVRAVSSAELAVLDKSLVILSLAHVLLLFKMLQLSPSNLTTLPCLPSFLTDSKLVSRVVTYNVENRL